MLRNFTTYFGEVTSSFNNLQNNATTEKLRLIEKHPHLVRFMISLYVLIFVVGIFGNILSVYVVIRNRAMHTITNKFIVNLCLSDILQCLLAVPFTPINALGKSWQFGELLCKLVPVVLLISVFVSTLTSVVIALDRYMIIVHPHTQRMTVNTQAIIIAVIWTLAASAAVPIGIYTTLQTEEFRDKPDLYNCQEKWPNNFSGKVYTWVLVTLQLIIPAIIITICYTSVSLQLHRRTRNRCGGSLNSRADVERVKQEVRRNWRINKMLVSMVVIFVICWLPLDLLHVGLLAQIENDPNFIIIFLFCHILAMSSVVYNPFLYGFLNENFKKHFLEIWTNSKRLASMCKPQKDDKEPTTPLREQMQIKANTTCSILDLTTTVAPEDGKIEESQPFLPQQKQENGYGAHLSPTDTADLNGTNNDQHV